MTGHSSAPRKPYDPAPYASLRTAESDGGGPRQHPPGSDVKATPASDFNSESERLMALREALWVAFEAGPDAGLPNILIDLTMAYTGSLRLQLSLRAIASRQTTRKSSHATLNPQGRPPK